MKVETNQCFHQDFNFHSQRKSFWPDNLHCTSRTCTQLPNATSGAVVYLAFALNCRSMPKMLRYEAILSFSHATDSMFFFPLTKKNPLKRDKFMPHHTTRKHIFGAAWPIFIASHHWRTGRWITRSAARQSGGGGVHFAFHQYLMPRKNRGTIDKRVFPPEPFGRSG